MASRSAGRKLCYHQANSSFPLISLFCSLQKLVGVLLRKVAPFFRVLVCSSLNKFFFSFLFALWCFKGLYQMRGRVISALLYYSLEFSDSAS